MKIGLIGFGSIGERHYHNLLAATGGKITPQLVVFSARTGIKNVPIVHNWQTFKNQGPYDAIFITNETAKHLGTIREVIPLKPRALFVEKPLSHSVSGLDDVAKDLRRANISLWVGYNLHFFKPLLRIKEIIKSKKIGKILYLRAAVGQDLRDWRVRDYRQIYSANKKAGGGVLLDLVHDLNYPAWLLDEPLVPKAALVRKVSALSINVEDAADSLLVSKSGVVVSVHQDYFRIPGKRSLEIQGEKGTVEWDSAANRISIFSKDGHAEETFSPDRNAMYQDEVSFFLKQVQSKKYFSNVAEAIADVKIIETIKQYGKN